MPGINTTERFAEIRESVLRGRLKEVEWLVAEAAESGLTADRIVKEAMIPAMRDAGEDFKNDPSDIPKLLCAARAMQRGMETLQPYIENRENLRIGKAIIGTVEGDLHEVGKNLVVIMFRSVGFEVIDLGVDVSERRFMKTLAENPDTDIICLSSLLTTSIAQMKSVVKKLRQTDKEHRHWIMVGGGSVTEAMAKEMGADAYTENAVDAAEAAKAHVMAGMTVK